MILEGLNRTHKLQRFQEWREGNDPLGQLIFMEGGLGYLKLGKVYEKQFTHNNERPEWENFLNELERNGWITISRGEFWRLELTDDAKDLSNKH